MKSKNPVTLLLSWFILIVTPTHVVNAAAGGSPNSNVPATATLTGQVSNAATQLFLGGALVSISGTGRTILTDRDGYFRIAGLPIAPVKVEVSYTGLTSRTVSVTLLPGQNPALDIALTSDIYMMDKFTVAGVREGQAMAITMQRNAPNVKNVAHANAFGNIADGNAAEALRLLPGVAAVNDENESRYLMVRGIDANLNSMTVDGVKFSTGRTGNNRAVDMSQIPLGAIEIMEVTKSPTPDMDGDSIGGNINLKTASIFDRADPRRITYAANATIRTFGNSAPPSSYTKNRVRSAFAFGYANVFGSKKNIGVALNLSHNTNHIPSTGLLINTWQLTPTYPAYMRQFWHSDYHSTDRTRMGLNLKLDVKLSEDSRIYLNTTVTNYISHQGWEGGHTYTNGKILAGWTDLVSNVDRARYRTYSNRVESHNKRYSFAPGGVHHFGDLEIDYSGLYQSAEAWSGGKDGDRDGTFLIRQYNMDVTNTMWNFDGTPDGTPRDRNRRSATQTGGPDVRDPLNWRISSAFSRWRKQTTDLHGGQINLKRHFRSPISTYLKAGLKFMSEKRHEVRTDRRYKWAGPQDAIAALVDTSLTPGNSSGGDWHPYGKVPAYLSVEKITKLQVAQPSYFPRYNEATDLRNALRNNHTATEAVVAGYVMGNATIGKLSVLGGLRVEETTVTGEAYLQDTPAAVGITDPLEKVRAEYGKRLAVEKKYRNVLPGLHFRYAFSENMLVRASWSTSFGRPNFGSIYPDTRIDDENKVVRQNNPGAKPQTADNFDLSIERYFEPIGVISAGVFLKEIKNFLYSDRRDIAAGTDNGFDGDYEGYELTTQMNGGFGRVKGLELNYSQQFSFLPGFWAGFGMFANYTRLSTVGNYGRLTKEPNSALANFTPRIFNGGISYQRGAFSGRMNINSLGEYMFGYSSNPLARQKRKEKNMVDLKLNYNYSRKLVLFFDVGNIFNAKDRWYRALPKNLRIVRNFGVRFQGGIRGQF